VADPAMPWYDRAAEWLVHFLLHKTLEEKGYPVLFLETADGHSWGNWRGVMDDMLRFFFGA